MLVQTAIRLNFDDVVVLFVGDRAIRIELEAANALARLIFAGFHNETLLSRFYNSADLLRLPDRHSGTWRMMVNEALNHGLPVVASDAVGPVGTWSIPELLVKSKEVKT